MLTLVAAGEGGAEEGRTIVEGAAVRPEVSVRRHGGRRGPADRVRPIGRERPARQQAGHDWRAALGARPLRCWQLVHVLVLRPARNTMLPAA